MDTCPIVENAKNLDNLSESEIREILSFSNEEVKLSILENLKESNCSLEEKSKENKIKIEKLREMNTFLMAKTWNLIGKDKKNLPEKNVTDFFNELKNKINN